MMVKKMVKKGGRWIEAYVDMGKGRAVVGHGAPMRMVHNQRIGPKRLQASS